VLALLVLEAEQGWPPQSPPAWRATTHCLTTPVGVASARLLLGADRGSLIESALSATMQESR